MKVLLIALAFIYVSGYYSVSSAAVKEKDEVSKTTTTADVSKVVHTDAQTTKNSIFGIADKKSGNNNKLPGAVLDEGGNFEKDEYVKEKRDLNMLPGAIGLEGAFDENKVDMFETEQDATTKSETSNEGEKKKKSRSESERIVESSGEKKKTKKKRKKKKKKKKADDSTKGEEDSKKSDGDKESGESKHKTGSKNQDDTSLDKDGLGEPKQKRKGTEGSQSSENGEFSGKDESTETADKSETQGKKKSSKSKGKRKETTNSTPPQTFVQSPGPLFTGPHPMNRKMEELQVPGNGEELNDQAVRKHYGKLVKAYLAPFADGIPREAFFEILKRRTYGMAPPGSNKGIQTLLFQLHAKSKF